MTRWVDCKLRRAGCTIRQIACKEGRGGRKLGRRWRHWGREVCKERQGGSAWRDFRWTCSRSAISEAESCRERGCPQPDHFGITGTKGVSVKLGLAPPAAGGEARAPSAMALESVHKAERRFLTRCFCPDGSRRTGVLRSACEVCELGAGAWLSRQVHCIACDRTDNLWPVKQRG